MTNQRYFIIKNPLFFTFHNKNGVLLKNFKSKWPYPESDQWTGNPLFTMTKSQRACQPVMTTRAFSQRNQIALRPCQLQYWKGIGRKKRLGDAWVSFHPTDIVNLTWYVRFWKKFTFDRAQDVVRNPLVYSADCGACWSQCSHSNSAREISRAIFARGGVVRHVVLSVCYTKLS